MILFHTHHIDGNSAHFDESEARHCLQVLRKKAGDEIRFVDGQGTWYEGRIEKTGKKSFSAVILSRKKQKKPGYQLHIGIAPTKNIERFEWFLEKATELGITAVTPLICENSERRKIRPDRLEKILLTAMKQSLSAWLPTLHPITDFQTFIAGFETGNGKERRIAHCRKEELPHLKDNCKPGSDVVILIGPEGDFSEQEISMALEAGFREVTLGHTRLRTETAGIAATHIVKLINE